VLEHVVTGGLTIDQAATILKLSTRQVGRLLTRYREGPATLGHGNRGRRPANRLDDDRRAQLVELATTTYAGVNRAHLAELLAEREGIVVAERTLRRILAEAGLPAVRRRRPPKHRSRRDRMSRAGLLLQVDGSRHDWLEGRGPILTLVAGIDDATGTVTGATFRAQEDAAGYLTMLTQTADRYGLPGAIYSDRHPIFIKDPNRPPTLAEQLAGKRGFTQVGRALDEAGIGWIGARSAQAKGRIERLWGTKQDRLVSELRLAGASTIDEANAVLAAYLARHNDRFAVPPADPEPAWRRLPDGLSPEAVFCFHYPRRVANDATISWPGGPLDLPRRRDGRSWAGASVVLQERLDGSLWIEHEGVCYPVRRASPNAAQLRVRDLRMPAGLARPAELAALLEAEKSPAPEPPRDVVRRPRPDHPWRRYRDPRQ